MVNYVQDQSIMERNITDPSSVSLFLAPTNQPTTLFPLLSISRAFCLLYCNRRKRAVKKVNLVQVTRLSGGCSVE